MRLFNLVGLSILGVSAHVQLGNLQDEPFLRQMVEDLTLVHKAMNFTEVGEELGGLGYASSDLHPAETALVRRMVRFSAAAYCPDLTLKQWICTHCRALSGTELVAVVSHPSTDGKGYVALDRTLKSIVVAFRGSYNIRNWITNINIKLKELDVGDGTRGLKAHTGFSNHAAAMSRKMIPIIRPLLAKYKKYTLAVTGHSLGAAVATLASIDFKKEFDLPWSAISLITYGEPRIGNPAFASWYNAHNPAHLRIVNNRDMVPHLPTNSMGYLHRKREGFLKNRAMHSCDSAEMEDASCSLSSIPFLSVTDHLFYLDITFGLIC
ncbi:hypothetical protein DSO57_1006893 [Entomophthora muscae]|uniref:Uncharacterized protein n=1 Tax=Entomophthora muscae TaxID=34485 RepID=A0ACC2T7C5_9FUNG|nr:hypothetical protein DSO57_1006893 [Entomophthora muscae]